VSDIAFLSMMLGTATVAGVLGAILGLGGGILLVPLLTLFFGVSLPYAMGASIVSVIATSCGAAAGHLSSGLANLRLGLFLATATVSGALLGAGLVGVMPARALQILFGLALGYSAFTTLRRLHVEVAESMTVDPFAQRFGLDGVYHDRAVGRGRRLPRRASGPRHRGDVRRRRALGPARHRQRRLQGARDGHVHAAADEGLDGHQQLHDRSHGGRQRRRVLRPRRTSIR